jgi:hypothetical protein
VNVPLKQLKNADVPALGLIWYRYASLIFVLKFVLLIIDPLPKFYLGDSFSYIYTAITGWIPADRSYFYGFVIRWLALSSESFTSLLIVQVSLGGLIAILAARISSQIFKLPLWGSFAVGVLCCIDPLQLLWERAVMTETISLFFYGALLHRSFIYLKRRRIIDLVAVQLLSILLIGFRMSYLALVTMLAVALPILAFTPVSLRSSLRLLSVARESIWAFGRKLEIPAVHFVVSVGAMLVLHQAYKTANGVLSHQPPDYLYGTGFHLLSFWAPLIEPDDAADPRLRELIERGGEFHIKERSARLTQRFYPGFLVDRWCKVEPDVRRANEIAKKTALRALKRHPRAVALLAWHTYMDHWGAKAIKRYASVDLKMGSFTEAEVHLLAQRFHYALTSPNLAAEPLTFTKRYYIAAYPYYFVILLLPAISATTLFIPGIGKRYAGSLFLQTIAQFGSTFVLTATPVVRYLQPLSLLTILTVALVAKVIAVNVNRIPKTKLVE